MSFCTRPTVAAKNAVVAPKNITTAWASGASSNRGDSRATMNTPAVTMVAAWIRAETGVGPSIASGNQVCSRNWADLPIAPMNSSRQVSVSASACQPKKSMVLPVSVAMHHEQDIRNMGGLKDRIPFTYIVMVIGTLALTGFPLTAGYFSKDAIIESAYASHNPFAFYGYLMTVVAAGLTSFYSWRLIFKTFHGEPHDQEHYEAAHESPLRMLIPIGILAAGSLLAGFPFKELFAGHGVEKFFRDSLKMNPHIISLIHI